MMGAIFRQALIRGTLPKEIDGGFDSQLSRLSLFW
jgi:hypothetical protein